MGGFDGVDTDGEGDGDLGESANDEPHLVPPPSKAVLISSPSSRSASPTRSSLVSKRLHGPRIFGGEVGGRRQRRKTVTFDERCDVLEFDRDESSMEVDDDPFETDEDDDQDDYGDPEEGALNGRSSHRQPSAQPSDHDLQHHGHQHNGQHHDEDEGEQEVRYLPADDSITGLMDSMLQGAGSDGGGLGDHERTRTYTPEHDVDADAERGYNGNGVGQLPPVAETGDGVPYANGRSERATATAAATPSSFQQTQAQSPLTLTPTNSSMASANTNMNTNTPSRPDSPRTPTIHSSNGKIHSGRRSRDARRNSGELGELTEQESEADEEDMEKRAPGPSSREGEVGEEGEEVPRFELENLLRDAPRFEGSYDLFLSAPPIHEKKLIALCLFCLSPTFRFCSRSLRRPRPNAISEQTSASSPFAFTFAFAISRCHG